MFHFLSHFLSPDYKLIFNGSSNLNYIAVLCKSCGHLLGTYSIFREKDGWTVCNWKASKQLIKVKRLGDTVITVDWGRGWQTYEVTGGHAYHGLLGLDRCGIFLQSKVCILFELLKCAEKQLNGEKNGQRAAL